MSSFLITGGAGFIGSHLAERLVADGNRVRVLDDFSTGNVENLACVSKRVKILQGSILDDDLLAQGMRGVQFVLHQAALPSVARSLENPEKCFAVNAEGTLRVLMAAVKHKIKRVVLASSSSVYGANRKMPKDEAMMPMPLSPYAASKLAAEHYAHVFFRVHGLDTVTLRYFNVFGPRQDALSPYAPVIPRFIRDMLEGRRPQIFGDGKQSRDFTFVDDVVEANLLACRAPKKVSGGVYNVAAGVRTTLLDLVSYLNGVLGMDLKPSFGPARLGDVAHSQANIAKAKRDLRYRVKVSFAEGLTKVVKAYANAHAK